LNEKHLHIISFDVPYPADYGGIIDIFYKIRTLWKMGVQIHLHCFIYGNRKPQTLLNRYCTEVNYYRRKTGLSSFLSFVPYIIKSRISHELENRLLQDDYPVLCEGIHTCGILNNPAFAGREILFRPSNVEHEYYTGLAALEKNIFKKSFFLTEARKLRCWERNLLQVPVFFPVSEHDVLSFRSRFPEKVISLLYSFHPFEEVDILKGTGDYVLFHGNLSVPDNLRVSLFLLEKVAPEMDIPLVIAGKNAPRALKKKACFLPNVKLLENPDAEEMDRLIREAHIHLLLTYQKAGLKLKLLLALFRGRHIIVNSDMLTIPGLERCVQVADDAKNMIQAIRQLKNKPFREEEITGRKKCLPSLLFNDEKGRLLLKYIH